MGYIVTIQRFFPIVGRELRVAARQKSTYWNRVWAAGLGLIVFFLCGLATMRESAHVLGQALFYSIAALAGMICVLSGSGVADSISSEKREGTLGLLFLTNLSGFDVVAGKIAAGSLGAVYRLIALLPILAITFLLGGVDMDAYLRVIAACASTLLLSLAFGVYWSSRLTNSWATVLAWLASMAFLVVGWPFLLWMTLMFLRETIYADILFNAQTAPYLLSLLTPSPGVSAVLAVGPQGFLGQYTWAFWASLGVQQVLAARAFWVACRRTQTIWREEELLVTRRSRGRSLKELLARLVHGFRWRHVPVQSEQPVSWLVRRSRLGLNVTLVIFALATVGYGVGLINEPNDWGDDDVFSFVMTMLHIWLVAWIAGEASAWIFRDRQSGALELILATPISVKDIIKGHFQGINRKLLWPVLWVLMADVLFMAYDRNRYHSYNSTNWFVQSYFGYLYWLSCMGMLLFNLYTIRWTATWMGMIARNEFSAAVAALVWCSLPTWGTIAIGTFSMIIATEVFDMQWVEQLAEGIDEEHFLVIWLALGTLNNLVMIWLSRRECRQLREYASLRPETGFWAQLKYIAGLFRRRRLQE
jgi:ABC-type transport system involved in cytochrome c biogenesis permease component